MAKKSLKHLLVIGSLIPIFLTVVTLYLYINFFLFEQIASSHKQAFIHQSLQISKLYSGDDAVLPSTTITTALLENPDINGIRIETESYTESFGIEFDVPAQPAAVTAGLSTYETAEAFIVAVPLKKKSAEGLSGIHAGNDRLLVNFSLLPIVMLQYKTAFTTLLITMVILSLAVVYLIQLYKKASSPINLITRQLQTLDTEDKPLPGINDLQQEYKQLYLAIKDVIDNIQLSKTEMQESVNQSNQDLRETLETIEIQNIELDLARKEAIKASKTKSEFLANTSHEIRTPLNGILGFTRLLSRTELNKQQQDYVNTIYHSSENLLTIINDILDLSKIEAGKLVLEQMPFNLEDAAAETLSILSSSAHEKQLELLFEVDPALPETLIGDALRIKQILTNLLGNAIKFCDRGEVTLEIAVTRNDDRFAHIKLLVRDTGPGFDQQRHKEIFSSFTQLDSGNSRQFSGTGLGLSITKKLVEEMGGEITAKSTPGNGSTFSCSIPLKKDHRKERLPDREQVTFDPVILFDEHEASCKAAVKTLDACNIKTTVARKFSDILPLVENHEKGVKPRLLISIPATGLSEVLESLLMDTLKTCPDLSTLILHPTTFKADESLPRHATLLTKPLTRKKLRQWHEETLPNLQQDRANKTLHRGHVLVVDDNRANLLLLGSILRELGCEVVESASGHDAFEEARNRTFDIIFMDIQMPGMDGLETTRRIRKEIPGYDQTPVIAVTAHAYDEQKRKIQLAGMNDCLGKPVNEFQLSHCLSRWLSHPETVSETEPPAVDIGLALKHCNQKADIAAEMLSALIEDLPATIAQSRQSLAESDVEKAVDVVHRLHGTSCYTGTPALQSACKNLEKALKESGQDYDTVLMHELEKEAERVIDWSRKNNIQQRISLFMGNPAQLSKN